MSTEPNLFNCVDFSPSSAIKRAYTRHYRDNGTRVAYVEWQDGSRTEAPAVLYHGVPIPQGDHMGQLFDRAIREGLKIEHEVW
jgi:hypothetical protein